jgi:hypothetical protein
MARSLDCMPVEQMPLFPATSLHRSCFSSPSAPTRPDLETSTIHPVNAVFWVLCLETDPRTTSRYTLSLRRISDNRLEDLCSSFSRCHPRSCAVLKMSSIASLLTNAAVPAFNCPAGTKVHILHLGVLQADEGLYVGTSTPLGERQHED